MEKVILLKTQLAEAADLARSRIFAKDRLAVILLDNFVEIQLSALMKQKFWFDDPSYFRVKKYSANHRKKILINYDELLKVCQSENIINADEVRLLTFCHNVRNNLYHKGNEEQLLTRIALTVLHDLIVKHQPEWKSARGFTSWAGDIKHPYSKDKGFGLSGNSTEDWNWFLQHYFDFIDRRRKRPSRLLADFLLEKMYEIKGNWKFVDGEFAGAFPGTEQWDFNDFLREFSFRTQLKYEIEVISELTDKVEAKEKYKELKRKYDEGWSHKREDRMQKLSVKIKSIAGLPIADSIERYISLKNEVFMMHDSLDEAASRLDSEIQLAIDMAGGK